MIWNREVETMPRAEMQALQGAHLRDTVARVYEHVPQYREKMQRAGIVPEDIQSIADLEKLPFTEKQDLRDTYPYGMFAVPQQQVVRVHASSGTTGKQTVVGYTEQDIAVWTEVMARSFAMAGVTNRDIVHNSYGYGLFTGGMGAHYGAERVGATTIPVSVGNTKRQIQIMHDFGSTVLCSTPSYALYMAETMDEMGIPRGEIRLRIGIFGAEPWTEAMREEIERRLHLKAFDIYGLSEIMGPGVSCECKARSGLHVQEDHFIPEIIDPETLQPLPEGSEGELVFTCVTKQALPLLRYRTHDISRITREPCACGRTTVRMAKPVGRTDDMLIIRGVNVFPSQIESVLLRFADLAPQYQIIVERKNNLDVLEILIEMSEAFFSDKMRGVTLLERKIRAEMESALGIAATIRLVEPRSIARSEGKAKRVIDNRKY